LSIGGGEDDDFGKKMRRAWREGKFRWMDVDITRLYKILGGKTENRKYYSIAGHFKDPAKFVRNLPRAAHHKGSVLYKTIFEMFSGVDWAGRRYTTLGELLGTDSKLGKDAAKDLKGETVTWRAGKKGAIGYEQAPSFLLSQIKGLQPVQAQNLMGYMAGEMEGFDALMNSLGLGIATTYGGEEGLFKKNKADLKKVLNEHEEIRDTEGVEVARKYADKNKQYFKLTEELKNDLDESRLETERNIRKYKKWQKMYEDKKDKKNVERMEKLISEEYKKFNNIYEEKAK